VVLRLGDPATGEELGITPPLTSTHLHRDRDHRTACAVVEPDPRQAGRVVLRNRTGRSWTVVPDGEEPKQVAPGQWLGVRPMRIDFGPARGQIR
jgi:hypothetical protein